MQLYMNLYRRLSNFQLAYIAGQSFSYLSAIPIRGVSSRNNILPNEGIASSVEMCMKSYKKDTWKKYYNMECYLISQGKYLEAYSIRELSQKCAVYYYKQGKKISNRILLAWFLYHSGDKKSAISVIEDVLKNPLLLKLTKSKLRLLRDIFSNNLQNNYMCNDLKIYNLGIENEHLVVSGPLAEEEGCDFTKGNHILVKINYIKAQNKTEHSPPDVSFYNGGTMKSFAKKEKNLPTLHCYVFHRFIFDYQQNLIKKNQARLTYSCDYIFGLGLPNMLPNILFQLLASSVKSIKLLGFNLYMSKTIYNSSYLDLEPEKLDIHVLKSSFTQHNIISQFQFIQALYNNDFFEADDLLASILSSGIKCYLEKLEYLMSNYEK